MVKRMCQGGVCSSDDGAYIKYRNLVMFLKACGAGSALSCARPGERAPPYTRRRRIRHAVVRGKEVGAIAEACWIWCRLKLGWTVPKQLRPVIFTVLQATASRARAWLWPSASSLQSIATPRRRPGEL